MVVTEPQPAYDFEGSNTAAARTIVGFRLPGDTEKSELSHGRTYRKSGHWLTHNIQ